MCALAIQRTEGDLDFDSMRQKRILTSTNVSRSFPPLHLSRSVDDDAINDFTMTSYRGTLPRKMPSYNYTLEICGSFPWRQWRRVHGARPHPNISKR